MLVLILVLGLGLGLGLVLSLISKRLVLRQTEIEKRRSEYLKSINTSVKQKKYRIHRFISPKNYRMIKRNSIVMIGKGSWYGAVWRGEIISCRDYKVISVKEGVILRKIKK